MPDLSPAETLRAAAARLRALAKAATPGPWTLYDRGVGWEINELPDCHDGTTFHRPDAEWIAALNPAVAESLARELELHATWIGPPEQRDCMGYAYAVKRAEHMLAFAHSILEQP